MFDEETTYTQVREAPKTRGAGAKVYFCEDCQSVLTPRSVGRELEYYCPQCRKSQKIDDTLVYVNTLKRTGASFSSKRFLSEDPTLPRKEIYYPNCGSMTDLVLFKGMPTGFLES